MHRRSLLACLAAAPMTARGAFQDRAAARVTVRDLEIFSVKVNRRGNWILVRLQTSAGVSGIGDASHGTTDQGTTGFLKQFFELLKGRSVFEIESLRQALAPRIAANRGTSAAVAWSALEQCLWDIQGKLAGLPVCDLLGGRLRSRVRNYANINRSVEDRTPAGFARMAEAAAKDGFDAVKLAPFDGMPARLSDPDQIEKFTAAGIDCARAVREAIGPRRDLLVDAHSRFDRKRGLALAQRFEPLNLFWLEEVTPAEPVEDLAAINLAAKMPTAGGENLYGVQGFYPYVKAGAVDILMPDIKYCGGVLELKKIAALAEGAGMPVAPHGPASPVGNLAAAHVSAGMPNFHILEFAYGEVPWRAELVEPPERLDQGLLEVPSRPGFGIELNAKTVLAHRAD
jgi:galactonate dehydratase